MSTIPEYKDLLKKQELVDARYAKKICLFLGAGVARNIGMPDWRGLSKNIVDFCATHKLFKHSEKESLLNIQDPLKVISYCIQQIEKNEDTKDLFKAELKSWFIEGPINTFKKGSCTIYEDLVEIYKSGKALIVQTNYDNVIESQVMKDYDIAHIPYLVNASIPLDNKFIVYLHGKYENGNYDDLVLTRKHYNDVYVLEQNEKKQRQKLFFNRLLQDYHIIFLGYSLQDTEIVQLIANKKEVEKYKQIDIIIDTCDIKKISNEIDAFYWQQFTNDNIKIYEYSIEDGGYNNFAQVINDIKKFICEYEEPPIVAFTHPENVEGL